MKNNIISFLIGCGIGCLLIPLVVAGQKPKQVEHELKTYPYHYEAQLEVK